MLTIPSVYEVFCDFEIISVIYCYFITVCVKTTCYQKCLGWTASCRWYHSSLRWWYDFQRLCIFRLYGAMQMLFYYYYKLPMPNWLWQIFLLKMTS